MRPRWVMASVMALSGLVLAGCEQPAPGITAFSGTNSVRTEALCWAFDADSLAPGDCARGHVTRASLRSPSVSLHP